MAPKIEEVSDDFDDDFDMPLPSRPVPPAASAAGSSSFPGAGSVPHPIHHVTDKTQFKSWTCVYPIYIDAKRPYGVGRRRIAREKSCWWPHSQLITNAAVRLQLRNFHEPEKTHPRDWENPGRVKIELKKDNGTFANRNITNKKQLLEALSTMIQRLDNTQTPLPEHITSAPAPASEPAPAPAQGKGKSSKPSTTPSQLPKKKKTPRTRAPKPPSPTPALDKRYGINSPAVSSGVLVDTVKVALKQQEKAAAAAVEGPGAGAAGGQAQGGAGGKGKEKRKVIRVRG